MQLDSLSAVDFPSTFTILKRNSFFPLFNSIATLSSLSSTCLSGFRSLLSQCNAHKLSRRPNIFFRQSYKQLFYELVFSSYSLWFYLDLFGKDLLHLILIQRQRSLWRTCLRAYTYLLLKINYFSNSLICYRQ